MIITSMHKDYIIQGSKKSFRYLFFILIVGFGVAVGISTGALILWYVPAEYAQIKSDTISMKDYLAGKIEEMKKQEEAFKMLEADQARQKQITPAKTSVPTKEPKVVGKRVQSQPPISALPTEPTKQGEDK